MSVCGFAQCSNSPLAKRLLNDWQRAFPLLPEPFALMSTQLGCSTGTVVNCLRCLQESGAISRIGPIFPPGCIGVSTLAALAIPEPWLESVANAISSLPQVNHNYQREHRYNLWFVVSARNAGELEAVLHRISSNYATPETPLLNLPLESEFHIDLGFAIHDDDGDALKQAKHLSSTKTGAQAAHQRRQEGPIEPSAQEWQFMARLQQGLPLVHRPFAELAREAGMQESEVLGTLRQWCSDGIIKRFGVIVRHQELGYRANAMVVFNLPDDTVQQIGQQLAQEPGVNLCYQRRRQGVHWPYNLYCMVHGRSREAVAPILQRLNRVTGSVGLPLFSLRRFKQCGASYAPLSEAPAMPALSSLPSSSPFGSA